MLTSLNKLLGITSVGLWRDLCRTGIILCVCVFGRIFQWSLWTWAFLCVEVFDINLISSTDTDCLFLYLWMNLSFKKSELVNIDKGIHSICRIPFIYNSVIFIVSFFSQMNLPRSLSNIFFLSKNWCLVFVLYSVIFNFCFTNPNNCYFFLIPLSFICFCFQRRNNLLWLMFSQFRAWSLSSMNSGRVSWLQECVVEQPRVADGTEEGSFAFQFLMVNVAILVWRLLSFPLTFYKFDVLYFSSKCSNFSSFSFLFLFYFETVLLHCLVLDSWTQAILLSQYVK